MDPENEGGEIVETHEADATILTEGGEPTAVLVELPETEIEPSSDAVAIAEIEANREITIAALHVDASIAEIESNALIETARLATENERENLWQNELNQLKTNIAALETTVANLLSDQVNLLIPTTPAQTVELMEPSLTPEYMLDPTLETETEVSLSGEGESRAETIAELIEPEKRRRRLI